MLRHAYRMRPRRLPKAMGVDKLGRGSGPAGRIERLQITVNALFRHERLEGWSDLMAETRDYAERLIQIAQKHGDGHEETMQLADYWLKDKDLIHKLFKVFVPRYTNCHTSYTQMWNLPTPYPGIPRKQAVLELKGNPYPPVVPHHRDVRGSLVNILLSEARRNFYADKFVKENKERSRDTQDADNAAVSMNNLKIDDNPSPPTNSTNTV